MGEGLDEVRRDWERLGSEDPLWAVLMRPDTRHGGWDLDEFLATGRTEVDAAMTLLRQWHPFTSFDRVLDFGCGAGRLSQALATYATRVVGVDVSASMIDLAGELDRTGGVCSFQLNEAADLGMFADGEFDLAYSSLVLQHLPPDDALRFLGELGRVVTPGGVVVVQVADRPTRSVKGLLFRYAPQRLLRFGQQTVLGYPAPMRMHGMPGDDVRSTLQSRGLTVLGSADDETYGGHWTYRRYFAVKHP